MIKNSASGRVFFCRDFRRTPFQRTYLERKHHHPNQIPMNPKKGLLLIAEPSIIGDLSFNRSVILLTEHNHEGSVGFILNKRLDFDLNDLVPQLNEKINLYSGGPVEQDSLYFIHNAPGLIDGSVLIEKNIYWGGDLEQVVALLNNSALTADQIQFFLGYSGWGPEQLFDEWQNNNWQVRANDLHHDKIHKTDSTYWRSKMKALGGDYLLWFNAPEDPSFN
jgi:putative transcriptional regulator